MHGNVIDMAVGILIGAAFGKIVDSLVKDLIMPPVGPYLSVEVAQKAGAVTFNYGVFINICIGFLIVAFAVSLLIREIRDALKK